MTDLSQRWRVLSERISKAYTVWPTTRAMALEGSVAGGVADESSDVDISVFCTELPTESQSSEAVAFLDAQGWKRHNQFEHIGIVRDCYHLDGARVDIGHVLVDTVDYALNAVLKEYDTAPIMQGFVGGFLGGQPLFGEPLFGKWVNRAKGYPDGLQIAMVDKHMWMDPLWIPEIYDLKRGDFLFLQKSYVEVTENVLGMLLGLNRMYQRGEWKRLKALIAQMNIVPNNLYHRLQALFKMSTKEGVVALSQIVEETFDLVEKHLPDLDVNGARISFRTDTDTEELEEGT